LFGSYFFLPAVQKPRSSMRHLVRLVNVVLFVAFVLFCYAFMWRHEMLVAHRWWWIGAGGLFCLANLYRLDPTELSIAAVWFGLAMQHNRGVADAVIVTFPLLTRNLTLIVDRLARYAQEKESLLGGSHPAVVTAWSGVLLLEAASIPLFGYHYDANLTR